MPPCCVQPSLTHLCTRKLKIVCRKFLRDTHVMYKHSWKYPLTLIYTHTHTHTHTPVEQPCDTVSWLPFIAPSLSPSVETSSVTLTQGLPVNERCCETHGFLFLVAEIALQSPSLWSHSVCFMSHCRESDPVPAIRMTGSFMVFTLIVFS